jgi:hypothetical protein
VTDEAPPVHYAVCCPHCRKQAVAVMVPVGVWGTYREALVKRGARRIICDHCGCHRELGAGHEGEYELWYATEFKGRRLWANNLPHLDFLIAWLSVKRNERRPGFPEATSAEALPKWFKARKNQTALLACLARLRATGAR